MNANKQKLNAGDVRNVDDFSFINTVFREKKLRIDLFQ